MRSGNIPIPKLPLQLSGLLFPYHRAWWRRTLRHRSVLTDWNRQHQAIFVHIPKTAGTSVLGALGAPHVFDTHAPISAYRDAYTEFYEQAFKFTFVRNPWDRFASAFHFLKNGTTWPMQQNWAAKHIGSACFAEFTYRLRSPLFRATVLSERFFWSQTFWLGGVGNVHGIDELFRFELFDSEVARLCERLNIARPGTMPRLRSANLPNFRTLYDSAMIDIVANLYSADIAALGYTFD